MTERSKIADEIEAFVADDESYLVTLALARFIKAHLPALLTALRAGSDAAVERAAKAIEGPRDPRHIGDEKLRELQEVRWGQLSASTQRYRRIQARAAIRAAVGGE